MRDKAVDGRLQMIAGMSLLRFSRLVQWDKDLARFTATSHRRFESDWRKKVNPVCGRFICWISFSTGAEVLAKGVCLLCGVEIRKDGAATNYGTLGDLHADRPSKLAPLRRLCALNKADASQEKMILKTYKHLAKDIRNRDAHAYVPNVRDKHFAEVSDQFVPCFNLLISWLPGGPPAINEWCENALNFIETLT